MIPRCKRLKLKIVGASAGTKALHPALGYRPFLSVGSVRRSEGGLLYDEK